MGAVRGRFPIPRSRRGLLVAGATLTFVLGGAAAGATIALTSANAGHSGLADASFPGYHLSFRYPETWKRKDWCWIGTDVFPLTLLRTGPSAPTCEFSSEYGSGTPLPPPQRLDRNGVSAWWFASDRAVKGLKPNTSIDGQPARVTVRSESTRRTSKSYVNCNTGTSQRLVTAQIRGPSPDLAQIEFGAVICGPGFASGLADVRGILDSVRFTS
jgi:hypothetical protein